MSLLDPIKSFSRKILGALVGTRWGDVSPVRPPPPAPPEDGRTIALGLLRRYISDLSFYRSGGVDANEVKQPPIPFEIPRERIHIEWPDYEDHYLDPPAIVFEQESDGDYESLGLNGYVEEKSRDVYRPGTVVQWQSDYVETISITIKAGSKAQRRAIFSGLETALSPAQEYSGLRFRMRDYFGQLVLFTAMRRRNPDDADSARNRREGKIYVEMRFMIVQLVNVNSLQPRMELCVNDEPANTTPPNFNPSITISWVIA